MQSDIVGFTKLGSRVSPEALCGMLHNLFSDFDEARVLLLREGILPPCPLR